MGWLVTIDALLWIAAIVLFFAGLGWWSLGCAIVAILLLLFLSPRVADSLSDVFFFID